MSKFEKNGITLNGYFGTSPNALNDFFKSEGYEILNKREAFSGDVTMVPGSLLEAAMMLQDRENEFNQLPIDIRREFNFNFNEYIAEAGKDIKSWSKKMGIYKETALDPLPEEGAPNEEGGEQ